MKYYWTECPGCGCEVAVNMVASAETVTGSLRRWSRDRSVNDGRAIPTFARQALENEPITVFGDGSQTRSFCYVDDLIRGLVQLAESGEHLPVNLGNPNEFSILELAQTVIRLTTSKSEIVFEALPIDDPQVRQPLGAAGTAVLVVRRADAGGGEIM